MCLFYYDNDLHQAERQLDLVEAINIFLRKADREKNARNLSTLLINAWFYYFEGDVNSSPVTYDATLFISAWKESIDKGLKAFYDSDCFCFAAGYTLGLHGFYFDLKYESQGHTLMERCRLITLNDRLLGLANYNLGNQKFPYKNKSYYKMLFPNNSIIDQYFCEMINMWKIK